MRIAVVSECHPGSDWAHAINVIKTAGGFQRLGHTVTLYCRPHPEAFDTVRLLDTYAEPNIRCIAAPAEVPTGDASTFARWAIASAQRDRCDFLYARHFHAAVLAADADIPAVLETHAYVGNREPDFLAAIRATARADLPLAGVVTINPTLREDYIRAGADPARISIVPDGVDLELFSPPTSLPASPWPNASSGGPRAVYAGRLFAYKGVDTLARAAALLPTWEFEILGGPTEERVRLQALAESLSLSNFHLHGHLALREIPRWLWSATALILPPSATEPSAAWTSPVKLGEYLAAGPSVVTSDIPGLRTWVSAPTVKWFTPDDPECLAAAIASCATESEADRANRRRAADELLASLTYTRRAQSILTAARLNSMQRTLARK